MGKTKKRQGKPTVQRVVDKRVCCGCGTCSAVCPAGCIEFIYGNRYNYPRVDEARCVQCGRCLDVCPSLFLLNGTDPGFRDEPWLGSFDCCLTHAADEQIRMGGSSGGTITGLIAFMLQTGQLDGAIVARSNPERPLAAESIIARDHETLLDTQASRYAPVSNGVRLREVLDCPGRYAFVGTPCMVEALTRAQGLLPALRERIVLKIGLVCAGMASHLGTRRFVERYGVDPRSVRKVFYRGDGWPGWFRAYGDDGLLMRRPLLGDTLVHLVPADHYLRCWNCMDHWGRCTDIVVSDPWTQEMIDTERKGWSAVMIRTEQGAQAMRRAVSEGAVAARSITLQDMIGFNRHLKIDSDHSRHAWMAVYQLLFFGRIRYAGAIIKAMFKRTPVGLRTTLKARLNKDYYEGP